MSTIRRTVFEATRKLSNGTRLVKFGFAGAAGMTVDNLVLVGLVSVAGLGLTASKLVAAGIAIFVSFLINERYTYDPADRSIRAVAVRYFKSNLVRSVGVAVALFTLHVLHTVFGFWYVWANFAGIACGFVANYVNESLFTWRIHAE